MRFVIIGGDAAGMSAASRARRLMPDVEIVVLEKTQDVSYSACGMPYNIADADRDMDDLIVRKAEVFRQKQNIDLRTGHFAKGIDTRQKRVQFMGPDGKDGEISYDNLLIATGASPVVPNLAGIDLPGVMVLKSLEDGRRIKDYLRTHSVKKAVIIGMGYIALEMCEALNELGIHVAMVKPRPVFLPAMDSTLANVIRDEVEAHGVAVYCGHDIQGIETHGQEMTVVCSDLELPCQMVLVAVGVTPNSAIASNAGLELGPESAIAVSHDLRTSDPNIFAAGDCADAYHVVTGQKVWIPLALRANRAGWAVADNVAGNSVQLPGIVGTAVFKVFDLQVARTGLNPSQAMSAGLDPVEVVIKTRSRAHAHPGAQPIHVQMVADRKTGRLLGAQMVGTEGVAHRINAAAVALHGQMTVDQFFQCDLAYAPPFGPVWDPLLTAANQLKKQLPGNQ